MEPVERSIQPHLIENSDNEPSEDITVYIILRADGICVNGPNTGIVEGNQAQVFDPSSFTRLCSLISLSILCFISCPCTWDLRFVFRIERIGVIVQMRSHYFLLLMRSRFDAVDASDARSPMVPAMNHASGVSP